MAERSVADYIASLDDQQTNDDRTTLLQMNSYDFIEADARGGPIGRILWKDDVSRRGLRANAPLL